jgi:hypothetical protein
MVKTFHLSPFSVSYIANDTSSTSPNPLTDSMNESEESTIAIDNSSWQSLLVVVGDFQAVVDLYGRVFGDWSRNWK